MATILLLLLGLIGQAVSQHNCHRSCSSHGQRVCGTDGRTYTNLCTLKYQICRMSSQHGHVLALAHNGSCTSMDHHRTPCDIICDDEGGSHEICGSNGVTYDSICDLDNAKCNASAHSLTAVHSGPCVTLSSSCADSVYAKCQSNTDYLCGTNGYTFLNECYLKQFQCRRNSSIQVLHPGRCHDASTNISRSVDCSQYVDMGLIGLAVEGSNIAVHSCPSTRQPICDTHGTTYSSDCVLCQRMALQHRLSLDELSVPIAHDGVCNYHVIVG